MEEDTLRQLFNTDLPNEMLYAIGDCKEGLHGLERINVGGHEKIWVSLFHAYQMVYDEKKGICKNERIKNKLVSFDDKNGRNKLVEQAIKDAVELKTVKYIIDSEGGSMTITKFPLDWLFNYCIGINESSYYSYLQQQLKPCFFDKLNLLLHLNNKIFNKKERETLLSYKSIFYSSPEYFIYFFCIYIYPLPEIIFRKVFEKSASLKREFPSKKNLSEIKPWEIFAFLEKQKCVRHDENKSLTLLGVKRNELAHSMLPSSSLEDQEHVLKFCAITIRSFEWLVNVHLRT